MRLPPAADGVQPAAPVNVDEEPVVTVDECRPRASDGSQPRGRTATADGVQPAATVNDVEVQYTVRLPPAADGVQPAATVNVDEEPVVTVSRRTGPPRLVTMTEGEWVRRRLRSESMEPA